VILLLLVSVNVLLALGGWHLYCAVRGIPAIIRVVRTRALPIAELVDGDVEIAGTIRAVGATVVSPSGRKCVFVDVALLGTRGAGKQRQKVHEEHFQRKAVADVVDASGAAVRLDFANVEVVAPVFVTRGATLALEPAARGYCDFGEKIVEEVVLTERAIEDGIRVCVSGVARVVDSKVETTEGGYRDGVPVEKKSFMMAGAPNKRMLVSEGSEAALLWRATWPVVVLTATSAAAFLFSALVIAMMRA